MNIFRYPGSKSNKTALRQLTAHFPKEFKEFRESFVGSGSVFATIDRTKTRWVNDFNPHLIAVYEALKARPKEFAALCATIPPFCPSEEMFKKATGTSLPIRLSEQFNKLLNDEDADPALRYLFLNRCGWNGRVILDANWRHRTYFSNPKGWNHRLFGKLEDAAALVADAKVTCSDFECLFDEPGESVFVYGDPPYMKETLLSKSDKLYEFGFSLDDHVRLRDCAARCQHKWMISYDDHPRIRELYQQFYIHEASWTYMGTSKRERGRELIITNYPCCKVGGLFDGESVLELIM